MMDIRERIQKEAFVRWKMAKGRGTVVAGTGVGKTKIAIDIIAKFYQALGPAMNVYVCTPTEVLRDTNWPEEAEKWGQTEAFSHVKGICYASLHTVRNKEIDLLVLDETHRITPEMEGIFTDNRIKAILGLTATYPDNSLSGKTKRQLLDKYAPKCFEYDVESAVDDKVVADFDIVVISVPMESENLDIAAGTKVKPFKTTETAYYAWLNKKVSIATVRSVRPDQLKFELLRRSRFIYNLPSKTRAAKELLVRLLPGKRSIVFCGSIAQAEDLCGTSVYHSKTTDAALKRFQNLELDYVGVVNALNEGVNVKLADQAIAVQINSNERDLVQRLGRVIRYREGHKGKFYVLVSEGTVDEKWVNKALSNFNDKRITRTTLKEFLEEWDNRLKTSTE